MRLTQRGDAWLHAVALCALCLVCVLLYANTLNAPFVLDDGPNIEANPNIRIRELSLPELYRAGFQSITKRPVAYISFALNYYVAGYDVTGYHVVNLIIHCANGILVYLLALIVFRRLSRGARPGGPRPAPGWVPWMSLVAALLFCAHPLQTQSVTYIVQRMASMAVMFYLLSLLLYLRGRLRPPGAGRWACWTGCLVTWLLALGSKQIAVVLPFAILLLEGHFFQDLRGEWLRRSLWIALASAVVAVLIGYAFMGSLSLEDYANYDFSMRERVLTQLRVVVFYIGLLLVPHPSRLNLMHDFPTSHSLTDPVTTLLSLLGLLSLAGFAVWRAREERLLSFCIAWFFLHLVIESSVLPLDMVFEHRLYLPMFGFALAASHLLFRLLPGRSAWALALAAAVIAALGTATVLRNRIWRDEVTLWQDVVSKSPQDHRARYNLGSALVTAGRYAEADRHFSETLRIRPDYAAAHNGLGMSLEARGEIDRAIFHFSEALRIGHLGRAGAGVLPDEAAVHANLALVLGRRGRSDEAIEHFSEALRIHPNYAKAHYGLGNLLARGGEIEPAARHFSEALRIRPDYAAARLDLATALLELGRPEEAASQYHEVLRLDPQEAAAHAGLGVLQARRGEFERAIRHLEEALRLDPAHSAARQNLGRLRAELGQAEEAP
jgi:tetratricopeptide (TPR) repeat protein